MTMKFTDMIFQTAIGACVASSFLATILLLRIEREEKAKLKQQKE